MLPLWQRLKWSLVWLVSARVRRGAARFAGTVRRNHDGLRARPAEFRRVGIGAAGPIRDPNRHSRQGAPMSDKPFPVVAIYSAEGMLRHTIDCVPTAQPGVWIVSEEVESVPGEAVVMALDPADLRKVFTREELRQLRERGEWPPTAQ